MIIESLLDNDFYKFTMLNAVLKEFYYVSEVEYEFVCRNGENLDHIYDDVCKEIDHLCSLSFTTEEIQYFERFSYLSKTFLKYLSKFKFNREHVVIENNPFRLKIIGPWHQTILFEVPVLAIINEVYHRKLDVDMESGIKRLYDKMRIIKFTDFKFADFGTRRRFSKDWHDRIINTIKYSNYFNLIGTSNVYLAEKYDLKPIGTQAHEWYLAGQALCNCALENFQEKMLQKWIDVYRGNPGIALTDTIGVDAFLIDFDKYFAKLYDGLRQDSGSPYIFANKIIHHYKSLGIDPKSKTIVFSDGLDFINALELYRKFKDVINVSFGIGTNLTNDFEGIKPLSIVIKMQKCMGYSVAKISDTPEKEQCQNKEYLEKIKQTFQVRMSEDRK